MSIFCLVIVKLLQMATLLLVSKISLTPHLAAANTHTFEVLLEVAKCRKEACCSLQDAEKMPPQVWDTSISVNGNNAEHTNLVSMTINSSDSSRSSGNF